MTNHEPRCTGDWVDDDDALKPEELAAIRKMEAMEAAGEVNGFDAGKPLIGDDSNGGVNHTNIVFGDNPMNLNEEPLDEKDISLANEIQCKIDMAKTAVLVGLEAVVEAGVGF